MWFKNLTVYRMTASWQLSAAQVEEAVSANAAGERQPAENQKP